MMSNDLCKTCHGSTTVPAATFGCGFEPCGSCQPKSGLVLDHGDGEPGAGVRLEDGAVVLDDAAKKLVRDRAAELVGKRIKFTVEEAVKEGSTMFVASALAAVEEALTEQIGDMAVEKSARMNLEREVEVLSARIMDVHNARIEVGLAALGEGETIRTLASQLTEATAERDAYVEDYTKRREERGLLEQQFAENKATTQLLVDVLAKQQKDWSVLYSEYQGARTTVIELQNDVKRHRSMLDERNLHCERFRGWQLEAEEARDAALLRVQKLGLEISSTITKLIPSEFVVRVHEGGGPEELAASLAVSVQNLASGFTKLGQWAAGARTEWNEVRRERDEAETRAQLLYSLLHQVWHGGEVETKVLDEALKPVPCRGCGGAGGLDHAEACPYKTVAGPLDGSNLGDPPVAPPLEGLSRMTVQGRGPERREAWMTKEWVENMAKLEDEAGGFPGVTGGAFRRTAPLPDGLAVDELNDEQYRWMHCEVISLIALDPPRESLLGAMLMALSRMVDEHERKHFPVGEEPTKP